MAKVNKNDLASCHRDPHLFYAIWKDFVEEFASGVSFEEFKNIMKTLESKPTSVKKLYEKQKTYLTNELHEDIRFMWDESKLAEKYNGITKLINEAEDKPNTVAWRPITGNCEHHLRAYRIKGLKEKKKILEELVQSQKQIKDLKKKQVESKYTLISEQLKKISDAEIKINKFNKDYVQFKKDFIPHENI